MWPAYQWSQFEGVSCQVSFMLVFVDICLISVSLRVGHYRVTNTYQTPV